MIPQKSGKIINICSLFSFLGGLGSPAYAAMKAGLMGLTKAYADELGKYGISVNGICLLYTSYKTACDRIMEEVPDMTLMGGHSSHSYINGTNMYFVYYYNICLLYTRCV